MASDPFDTVNQEKAAPPASNVVSLDPFSRVNGERQAKYGLAAVNGVAPSAAAQALTAQPQVGVPAATGMYNPTDTAAQLKQAQQASALDNPAVASYVANANPAHVAAVQDDLPGLAKVADTTSVFTAHSINDLYRALVPDRSRTAGGRINITPGQYLAQGGPIGDIAQQVSNSITGNVPVMAQEKSALASHDWLGYLKAEGKEALNILGLVSSPFAAPAQAAARAFSKMPDAPAWTQIFLSPKAREIVANWGTEERAQAAEVAGNLATIAASSTPVIKGGKVRGAPGESAPPPAPPLEPEGLPSPGVNASADAFRSVAAEADAASASRIQNEIATTATAGQSPTSMEDFLTHQLGDRTVGVNPQVLVDLAAAGHEPFPDHAQEIAEAQSSGGLVDIPMARYLAATNGQSFAEELNGNTVFRDGGVSQEQAKTGVEPGQEFPTGSELDTSELKPHEIQRVHAIAAKNVEAVQQVFAAQYLAPLFSEAKALDLTEPQMARLSSAIQGATETARDRALQKAYNQVLRERKPDFVEAAKTHTARIAEEINGLPVVKAMRELSTKGYKLDKDLTANFFPEPAGRLPPSVVKANGNHPDLAADALGYDSGSQLVSDLADLHSAIQASGAKNLNEYVKLQSKAAGHDAAASQLGFDLNPQSLAEAAEEMVPHEAIEKLLADELRVYAGKAGLPFDKAGMKALANELFQRLPAKKAVGFKKLEEDVGRNGRASFAAAQKGDWPKAFKAKQGQYLRRLMLRQAFDFQKVYNRALKDFKRFAGSDTIKSMDQTYLNLIHSVLREHGYDVPLTQLKYNYTQWADDARAAGQQVLPFEPVQLGDPKDLPVEQFTDLSNRVENLAHLGRAEKTAEVQGKKEELNDLVFEAVMGAKNVPRRPVDTKAVQPTNNAMSIASLNAVMNSPEVMFDILDDHNPNGVFNRLLMQGSRRAAGADNTVLRPEIEAVGEAFDGLTRADWDRWGKRIPAGHGLMDPASPTHEMSLTHDDLIGIALNAGSEHGRWHLEEGGNGWQPEDWTKLLADNMTPKDWEFVRSIAGALESAWPKIAEGERGLYGVVPEKAEMDGYMLPDKWPSNGIEVPGHYFPLKRDDARASRMTGPPKISEQELFDHFVREASTPAGHTKRRTWAKYPVSLDWRTTLNQHLPNVSKRLSYTQFVLDASKFLRQPEIAQLVHDVHGPFAMRELNSWIHRQVGYSSVDPRLPAVHQMIARELRLRTYAVMTGLKLSIGAEHLTSVMQTAAVTSAAMPFRAYARTIAAFFANPGGVKNFVEEASPYMAARHNSTSRELRDTLDDINNHKKLLDADLGPLDTAFDLARKPGEWVNKLSATFFNWINHNLVAVPTWYGAYWDARGGQAKLRGAGKTLPAMDHDQAAAYADKVIGKSHGSGLELDMGSFQSGGKNELLKLTNMFNVFRGTIGHIAREGIYIVRNAKTPQAFLDGLLMVVLGTAGVTTIGKLVTDRGPKKLDPLSLTEWMVENLFDGLSHVVPYGDQVYKAGENFFSGKPIDFEVSPAEGTVKYAAKGAVDSINAVKAAFGDRKAKKAVKRDKRSIEDVATFLGFLFKAPLGQPGLTAQAMYDINHGHVKRPVPALVFGPSHEAKKK